ncbi:low density lipoprotein receptor adapter protein 1-A isoform X3 [Aplysia californica]|uniref:Low density lipoprotein receptor adapter protein 1-A isoform X3 n=1 Tax=Aplysia californica TaxID=6500 RepID=A0ABM1VSG0_APLCA|nr:low density lipoprotein receptor adapter protein 1-A isoform X3 [Aplysia californica]
MDALFRAVRKSPNVFHKDQGKKIPEGWGENKEPVEDGVTFYLKYIGSTLVEEIESDETYGDGISAKAVHNVIALAKSAGNKLKKTALTVSPRGISMVDMMTNQVMFDISIYRISFCTADKTHDKVFAYIARNTTNETMECYAFLCPKTKIAQAVTLTVSQAFSIAQDRWIEKKKFKKSLRDKTRKDGIHKKSSQSQSSPQSSSVINSSQPLLISSPPPGSNSTGTVLSSPSKQQVERADSRKNWESFDDNDSDDIDDMFSQLAENRSKQLPTFGTDLKEDELDDGVEKYMGGSACYEAFARTKSVEDLLNL